MAVSDLLRKPHVPGCEFWPVGREKKMTFPSTSAVLCVLISKWAKIR